MWYPSGWLTSRGVLDFAGGLVVEGNSGVSAFVLAALVGWQARRAAAARSGSAAPEVLTSSGGAHSVLLILLGAGLLHFGCVQQKPPPFCVQPP